MRHKTDAIHHFIIHYTRVILKKYTLMALMALVAITTSAQTNNVAEEVAWMIGDQPIWKSEIEEMYQQMQYERTPINGNPYCVIPENIAIEKLYLHQAEIDTVEVQEGMVSQQVDSRINYLITNLNSKEKVEEYFRKPVQGIGGAALTDQGPEDNTERRAPLLRHPARRQHSIRAAAG